MTKSPAYLTVNLAGSMECSDSPQTWKVPVEIDPGAPLGPHTFEIVATSDSGTTCSVLATVTVELGVSSLEADPTSIMATTAWPGMPPYNFSEINVEWDPLDCEGRLEIVELEAQQGYLPSDDGLITRMDQTRWEYTAFTEPQTELCPKPVKVWIAAMAADDELERVSVLVRPVHDWWTHGHQHGPGQPMQSPTLDDYA